MSFFTCLYKNGEFLHSNLGVRAHPRVIELDEALAGTTSAILYCYMAFYVLRTFARRPDGFDISELLELPVDFIVIYRLS